MTSGFSTLASKPPLMEQDRPADEVLNFLNQVGGEENGFLRLQNAQQDFIKILPVEQVIARKGLIHKDIVRPLAQSENDLELVLLPGGESPYSPVHGELEEVHQQIGRAHV